VSENYRGRIIDPRAYELSDGTGWTAEVYVAEDLDSDTIDTRFYLESTFPSKESALKAALLSGKHEVDKRIQSSEVQEIFDEANEMPATSQQGYSSGADIGISYDGHAKAVRRPKNPE